jgi:[acyl-carrier-protein] S-malonyltransferase
MIRIPMIFPGQASQSVGMAADLMTGSGPATDFLSTVDQALDHKLTSCMTNGPAETLTETWNAQPAILAHSVAVALELRELGITPSVVAGHSLGEYSAAVSAGALDPLDALRLVRTRGELMFAAGQEIPGTMAAILGLDAETVTRVCAEVAAQHGVVVVANHNSNAQIAISGEVAAVEAACVALKEAGARRAVPLNVSGAFHSPLLKGAAQEFSLRLDEVTINEAACPLIANVTASPATSATALKQGFDAQLTSPVRWFDIMTSLCAGIADLDSPKFVLEVGPGRVLSNMAKREFPEVTFIPVGNRSDLETVLDKLGQAGQ